MKVVALVVVSILAAAAFVVPPPSQPVPRSPDPSAPAPYTVCSLPEAARRSTALTFLGGGEGSVKANVFSGGEFTSSADVALGESGTGVLDLSEVTGLARAPVLMALDDPVRVAETVLTGTGMAATSCGAGSNGAQAVVGGATAEGDVYTVVVANPFAVSATVNVLAASEVGTESDPTLLGVVVPPRSVVPIELNNLLPGRQAMSAAVVPSQGRVVVGAIHQSGEDFSAATGMEADLDWYVPVPDVEDAERSLVLMSPDTSEVPFQLDLYGPDGVVEAAHEGTVPAQGQVVVPVSDLMEGPGVVRVVSAGPVTAGLSLSVNSGRAVLPGSSTASPTWLLPGAGRLGDSRVLIFNPGTVNVTAQLMSGSGQPIEDVEVPASSLVQMSLGERGVGARLEADGDVVVHWLTLSPRGAAGDVARAPAE